MNKQEFLNILRISLNGKIGYSSVEEHISFYENYINTQIRLGKREQDVLDELGDPRLIARSILEAANAEETIENNMRDQKETDRSERKKFRLPVWFWIFIIVFFIVLILCAVFSILWSLLPIILPVFLVFVLINVIRKSL